MEAPMARIAKAELERLKREISLQRLVEAKGIELARHGQDLIGLCPFHDDKSPSLVVSPKSNLWHCLGACQAGGSVIDWVMKAEGVSFRHAVELLRNESPSLAAKTGERSGHPRDGRGHIKRSTVMHLDAPIDAEADKQTALCQAVDYYHDTLKQSAEALGYLEKRGLDSAEMLERFRLGFCDRTLCYRLPQKNRKEGAQLRSALQSVGLLRSSGHEHFRGSLVVPVVNEQGKITEVYGRKINHNLRAGTPKHLYLPGPHRGVWNEEALGTNNEVILCEALLDALTFWRAGYRNVTSSYGIEGFTPEHLEAFERHGIERVLIAYDRDEAGDQAAAKLAQGLGQRGFGCFRVEFPKGMDANAYALAVKPATRSLGLALESARWMGEGEAPALSTRSLDVPERSSGSEPTPSPLAAKETDLADAATPRSRVDAEVKEQEVVLRFGERRWRVRGLSKNMSYELLRVNLLCSRGERFHVDTFDLYSARHRASFLRQAALELELDEEVLKKDLGRVLLKLEELQEQQIQGALEPQEDSPEMSAQEREEALALLREPRLLDEILADFERCGVVGEQTNKLTGYLAAVSRKLASPLAVLIQSSSAAGKSSLMEAVLSLMPAEERVKYSAMTGQSLFYMGETNLKHKILAIVEEEGAERAAYALKLLQSEGELSIASTGKDPVTGKLVTHEYRVEGPVMIFLTTTAVEIDEELLNRCLVLSVDEKREQTRAIHRMQREADTLEGLHARCERGHILKRHQNAQRLLRPLQVLNPYARELTFLDDRTRTRRDHLKYLGLIRAIALLHQHQRPVRTTTHRGETLEYIEATLEDIAVANHLANEVLGRSLDELPPQTRSFLLELDELVRTGCAQQEVERSDYRFSRREVREGTRWSATQIRVHLGRLLELEYVLAHRGKRGQSYEYELLWDGEGRDGRRHVLGLLDTKKLRAASRMEQLAGSSGELAESKRSQNGQKTGGWRPPGNGPEELAGRGRGPNSSLEPELALLPAEKPEGHRTVVAGGGRQ
jgi:DNA primase catalytic core